MQTHKIKVAIAGGTGYTAGELLRLLVNHPHAEITAVLSGSAVGEPIATTHRDLLGDTDLRFTASLTTAQAATLDVLFLCLGHGVSRDYLAGLELPDRCRIIDLGNDFRLDPVWQGREFVYGLTEARREAVHTARAIANPGCFATSILLPLVPLAAAGLLRDEVHIHSVTGSTGAGKTPSDTTHFSYRAANFSVYKPFTHQHLGEIWRILGEASEGAWATDGCAGSMKGTGSTGDAGGACGADGADSGVVPQINMVPMRGDFTRGIFTSLYTRIGAEAQEAKRLLAEFYAASPFVHVSDLPVSLKEVVNTNKALIHIGEHNGYLHFTCVLDNLLKGASGQAVQNMNVMFGLDESCGLRLKASTF